MVAIVACLFVATPADADELLFLENALVKVGVDPHKGGAITWLSWETYPDNSIHIADRLDALIELHGGDKLENRLMPSRSRP
ncbi:MAG: hypothetical protein KDA51_14775 [Planctomycetales bacterium]|nr:hypothetical protein [Planctomycetales bacterium]